MGAEEIDSWNESAKERTDVGAGLKQEGSKFEFSRPGEVGTIVLKFLKKWV